jgi:alkylation response protein AidB-like acyl-CoA dehydrogenase
VDFELNEEQRLFRDTLRDFVAREVTPVASELERSGEYPTRLVEQLKELGLFGMTVPSEFGGSRKSLEVGWACLGCWAVTRWHA